MTISTFSFAIVATPGALFLRQAPAPPALIMTSTTEGKAREAGRGVEKDSGELGNWEK